MLVQRNEADSIIDLTVPPTVEMHREMLQLEQMRSHTVDSSVCEVRVTMMFKLRSNIQLLVHSRGSKRSCGAA